jgi:hypothetical protein
LVSSAALTVPHLGAAGLSGVSWDPLRWGRENSNAAAAADAIATIATATLLLWFDSRWWWWNCSYAVGAAAAATATTTTAFILGAETNLDVGPCRILALLPFSRYVSWVYLVVVVLTMLLLFSPFLDALLL